MLQPFSWMVLSTRVLFFYIPFMVIGFFVDNLTLCLLVATIVHLAWHYNNQKKLADWLWHDRRTRASSRDCSYGRTESAQRLRRQLGSRGGDAETVWGCTRLPDGRLVLGFRYRRGSDLHTRAAA